MDGPAFEIGGGDAYRDRFSLPLATPVSLYGNYTQPHSIGTNEATMDLEMILAASEHVPTTMWVVNASQSWLGWATTVAAMDKPPLVNSISWAFDEVKMSQFAALINVQLLKLCTRGVTVVASAGDGGATNSGHNDPVQCAALQPQFPACSPWVTAVGATAPCRAPTCPAKVTRALGERAATFGDGALFTTGGGFATIPSSKRRQFQEAAVGKYLAAHAAELPRAANLNVSGAGYPDVSALGVAILVNSGPISWQTSWGTSAAAPMFAGMVSRLNAARLSAGKPPVGFINPLLYHLAETQPSLFYDVTEGSNNWGQAAYCPLEQAGYAACAGWDPVSGLGTVANFTALQEAVLAL